MTYDDDLILIKPTMEYDRQIQAFRKEFLEEGGSMDGTWSLRRMENTQDWINLIRRFEDPENFPQGWSPTTQFMFWRKSDQKIVGMIQIRHYLTEYLQKYSGHIGYCVCPSERRKGYATRMLHEIMPYCRKLGINRLLVSCLVDNIGSRKAILANGGVFEETVREEKAGVILEKYWIDLYQNEYIETPRLILRKARSEDLDEIYNRVWKDSRLNKMMLWRISQSIEEARIRMKKTISIQNGIPAYFICLKENPVDPAMTGPESPNKKEKNNRNKGNHHRYDITSGVIGFVGVREENVGTYCDTGLCICVREQGKGYGSEALQAMEHLVFHQLCGDTMMITCMHGNKATEKLAEKNGFIWTESVRKPVSDDGRMCTIDSFEKKAEFL